MLPPFFCLFNEYSLREIIYLEIYSEITDLMAYLFQGCSNEPNQDPLEITVGQLQKGELP